MKVAVIANCTKAKLGRAARAEELYRGTFSAVRRAAEELRRAGIAVEVYVVSARHGLLRGWDVVEPYDAYLGENPPERWVEEVGAGMARAVEASDLAVISLTGPYARALSHVVYSLCDSGKAIAILPRSMATCAASIGVSGPGQRMRAIRLVASAIASGVADPVEIAGLARAGLSRPSRPGASEAPRANPPGSTSP